MARFPARNKVPEFTVFASLLRMVTKYGFSGVCDGLGGDLKSAYPTKWEDIRTTEVLGEDVFGSPKPHPNAVLNLFLEQNITFGLPFAAYRAGRAGFSSLIGEERGTALPRLALASTIHGIEKIRRTMVQLSHSIVYNGNLRVCPRKGRILNMGINPVERGREALKKVVDDIMDESKGDLLAPFSLESLMCANCASQYYWGPYYLRARGQLGHVSDISPTMASNPGYHHHKTVLATNISDLLCALGPSTYDEVAPKIEYWIEHVITERFMTADDLVEQLSPLAWKPSPENHRPAIPRFLKEFHDAPNRSKGAKSFVDEFSLWEEKVLIYCDFASTVAHRDQYQWCFEQYAN